MKRKRLLSLGRFFITLYSKVHKEALLTFPMNKTGRKRSHLIRLNKNKLRIMKIYCNSTKLYNSQYSLVDVDENVTCGEKDPTYGDTKVIG